VETETTRFVGSVPEVYDRELGPVLFDPYARDLAQRVGPKTRSALEIAAGTGRLTAQLLASMGPDATLVATDLNAPMLDEARRRIADPRVRWETADARSLPFPDARFELVACQFGLMFVPDKSLALREMHRVLAPGGRLLINTWNAMHHNAAQHLVHRLAVAAFPDDPPQFLEIPFSMPDPVALSALVTAAGFTEVAVDTVAETACAESAVAFAVGLVRGTPLWHQLVERELDGVAFEAEIAATLVRAYGDKPCRSPLSAHVVTALAAG